MLFCPGLQLYQGVNWKEVGITNVHELHIPKYDQNLKEIYLNYQFANKNEEKYLEGKYFLVKISLGLD